MTFPDASSASAELFERAARVMPGGNTRLSVLMDPYPIYAAAGDGPWVTDVDGVRRLDFGNNYTSLLHGHAHPSIVQAVIAQLSAGTCFALPTLGEIELAELLVDRIVSAERIRFTNSGTEAVMMAIKAARAYTSRPMIAKIEGAYHGGYDPVEVSLDSTPATWGGDIPNPVPIGRGIAPGVLESVVVLPFNNAPLARKLIDDHADSLAAVIIDAMPRRVGLIPADPEFLSTVRAATREHGIVLIDDEVISFRLGYQGALGDRGIEADLTVLGKIIGGGFPIGAVAGNADIMSVFDASRGRPAVPHNGTFNANPISMTAGLAAMRMWTPEAVRDLNVSGDALRSGLAEALAGTGQVTGAGSLFRIHLKVEQPTDYRSAYTTQRETERLRSLHAALLDAGYLLLGGGGALSTVMTDEQVAGFVSAVRHEVRQPEASR